jgi:signal transduction histidine kinase
MTMIKENFSEVNMVEEEIRVLLIEDNPDDEFMIELMLEEVSTGTTRFILSSVERLKEGFTYISKNKFDIILLDLTLPDSYGLNSFTRLHTHYPDIPIVVLSGLDDESVAIKAVREGAQDYLVKGLVDSNLISHAIRYAIQRHRLVNELESSRIRQREMKERFLSLISHELTDPLNNLNEFMTRMLEELSNVVTQEQMNYMEVSLGTTRQLQRMINDLLQIANAEAGGINIHPQCVSVYEIIDEALSVVQKDAHDKDVELKVSIEQNVPFVRADPKRFCQILINLLNNSIRVTPKGKTVTIKAEIYHEDPNFVCISIADEGRGMTHEEEKKIFDYLYQPESSQGNSPQNAGVGLYICKELIMRHGGQIWVQSKLNKGTTFLYTLPVFNLNQILITTITPEILQKGLIMFINIEAKKHNNCSLSKDDRKVLWEIWNIIDRCSLPDLDVLLPRIGNFNCGEIFFLIACTNESGSQVLMRRIKEQLAHSEALRSSDFDTVILSRPLEYTPFLPYDSYELAIENLANTIQELIKKYLKINLILSYKLIIRKC